MAAPQSTSPIAPRRARPNRSTVLASTIDALAVVAFVVIGRRSHDEGSAIGGVASVSAPFLLALAVGWLIGAWLGQRRSPMDVGYGIYIWTVTVALGLPARRFLFGRSTAASFAVVAAIVLASFLIGWRAVNRAANRTARRRPV